MSQLQEAVELVDGVLGPTAVGVYLHGSSVLAGLRPAGDIDLLVLSRQTMGERERHALLEGLLEISAPGPAAHHGAGRRPPLTGPRPARVIDPVPHRDLTRASTAGIPDLLDELEDDTRNVVLTLARIWTTLATGEITPKNTAADWALTRLPAEHRPVLEHARNLYLNRRYSEETWSDELRAQARPHTEKALAEISRLRQEKA
ncbi:aminoglycoside adenylyltransferase domain-containing protein [Streptomyces pini]|uniref:Adenylyltransferase AadA C-terminal domain-containing protein n=1 Tax=Streptomyces pini TaxID=1520580 RepID=A0A1I3UPM7_9ACTN|nr:aminoglycoside adenylyltransferase domain-containing protein [Streptomyces pini]SFJ83821.1 protein of unknown function [Streptomyces pini]